MVPFRSWIFALNVDLSSVLGPLDPDGSKTICWFCAGQVGRKYFQLISACSQVPCQGRDPGLAWHEAPANKPSWKLADLGCALLTWGHGFWTRVRSVFSCSAGEYLSKQAREARRQLTGESRGCHGLVARVWKEDTRRNFGLRLHLRFSGNQRFKNGTGFRPWARFCAE